MRWKHRAKTTIQQFQLSVWEPMRFPLYQHNLLKNHILDSYILIFSKLSYIALLSVQIKVALKLCLYCSAKRLSQLHNGI